MLSFHCSIFIREHVTIERALSKHTRMFANDRELDQRMIPNRHLSAKERRPVNTCKIQVDRLSQNRCEIRGFHHVSSDHVDRDVTVGIVPFPGHLEANIGASTECERGVDVLPYAVVEFRDRASALFVIELCQLRLAVWVLVPAMCTSRKRRV